MCRCGVCFQSSRERGFLSVSPATGQGSPWLPRSTSNDRQNSAARPETVVLPASDLGEA